MIIFQTLAAVEAHLPKACAIIRERIEEPFGWGKTVGRLRQTVFRGLRRVDQPFKLNSVDFSSCQQDCGAGQIPRLEHRRTRRRELGVAARRQRTSRSAIFAASTVCS
jgi:hypothetical protein